MIVKSIKNISIIPGEDGLVIKKGSQTSQPGREFKVYKGDTLELSYPSAFDIDGFLKSTLMQPIKKEKEVENAKSLNV